jgi:hypothetical protein
VSSKKRGNPIELPPAQIIRGAQITAEYLAQEIPVFRDNPLIEAQPPPLTPVEITEYLLQLPPYSPDDRELSQVARLQLTETAREFFVPNGKHLTVYFAITNMIRRGYVRRNPVQWEYWKQAHSNIKSFLQAIKENPFPNSRARGLAIVGSGGTGKSTTVERILQSLPQVITHVSYKERDFILKQLVWLKLDCPRNGSLRDLCVTFFRVVDEVLGTEYKKHYAGNSRRTLEDLIAGMARVSANHCLGIIIIDEIQDLSEARSGGDVTMVNFFVHMENAIGVPFALIGTQDAIPILSLQFRQARRVSEQGYIAWDRMSEVEPEIEEDDDEDDEEAATPPSVFIELPAASGDDEQQESPNPDIVWKNFVETLWTYQYVKRPRELKENVVNDKCAHTLYRSSKGIPAVVQTIFVLTQQLAILSGEETITPRIIRETVRQNQQVISEMLGEARMKKPRELRPVGDLADLDQIYEAELLPAYSQAGSGYDNDSTNSSIGGNVNENSGDIVQPIPANTSIKSKVMPGRKVPSSKGKSTGTGLGEQSKNYSRNDLRNPNTRASEQVSPRGSRKNKYSRPPDEYLKK